jgi:hypothetical protein
MDSKNRKYICSCCNKTYARRLNLKFHENHCGVQLLGEANTTKRGTQHGEGVATNDQNRDGTNDSGEGVATNNQNGEGTNDKYFELESAFKKSIITFRKKIHGGFNVLDQIYTSGIPEKVSEEAKIRGSFKWYTSLMLQFYKPASGAITEPPIVFSTDTKLLLRGANYETISLQSQSAYTELLEDIETFSKNGSGWVVDKIIASDISIANMPKGIYTGTQDDNDDNDDEDSDDNGGEGIRDVGDDV